MLSVPEICFPLLREQRTHYKGDLVKCYTAELEVTFRGIHPWLPEGGKILDIGCGMAGIDVFLGRHYGEAAHITLCDKQGVSREINAGFNLRAEDFAHYHDFAAANALLKANGVTADRCIDLLQEPFPSEEFDVVISLLSWGFHYPISTYRPKVKAGGLIVADIRKGTNGLDELSRIGSCLIVHEAKKYRRVVVQC